jgi:hypothetical protein
MNKLLLLLPLLVTGCVGFCSAVPDNSEVTLYVSDAKTGRPIAAPTFSEAGQAISAQCGAESCLLYVHSDGATHQLVVSAPGYRSQTVPVTTTDESIHLGVELSAL